jgi:integrase
MFAAKHYRDSTIAVYTQRAESLLAAYAKETGSLWASDPMAFIRWFHHRGLSWRHSTFRMSRLSMLYYLERCQAPIEMLNTLSRIQHKNDYATGPDLDEHGTGSSAKRIRRFPDKDLMRYLDILAHPLQESAKHQRKSAFGTSEADSGGETHLPGATPHGGRRVGSFDHLLWLFLQWNIQVGVRPSEVGDMEIVRTPGARQGSAQGMGGEMLAIRNRKVNEVRGNGDFRMLTLRGDALDGARAVIQERDRFYAMGITWKEIQNGMMRRMNQIRHEAGGPSYTLYSTRHQFAANAKASGLSAREVADRMGHASIETAQSAYGKKISGKPTGTGIEYANGVSAAQLHAMREQAAGRIRSRANPLQDGNPTKTKEMAG